MSVYCVTAPVTLLVFTLVRRFMIPAGTPFKTENDLSGKIFAYIIEWLLKGYQVIRILWDTVDLVKIVVFSIPASDLM